MDTLHGSSHAALQLGMQGGALGSSMLMTAARRPGQSNSMRLGLPVGGHVVVVVQVVLVKLVNSATRIAFHPAGAHQPMDEASMAQA